MRSGGKPDGHTALLGQVIIWIFLKLSGRLLAPQDEYAHTATRSSSDRAMPKSCRYELHIRVWDTRSTSLISQEFTDPSTGDALKFITEGALMLDVPQGVSERRDRVCAKSDYPGQYHSLRSTRSGRTFGHVQLPSAGKFRQWKGCCTRACLINADVRPAIRVSLQINEADGRDERIQAMALLAAWKKAIKRTAERDTAEAAAVQSGRPLISPNSDHISRRAAFETKFHTIREEDIPSKSYIEMLETRLSEADLRAEPLKEVTTREIEDEAQEFFERDAASGFLKSTRARKKQKDEVPKGPEELRKVIKRMGIAWSMLAILASTTHCGRREAGKIFVHVQPPSAGKFGQRKGCCTRACLELSGRQYGSDRRGAI